MVHNFEGVFVTAYEGVANPMFVLNDARRVMVMTGIPAKLAVYFGFYFGVYGFVSGDVFGGENQQCRQCHYCDDYTMGFHEWLNYLIDVTH
jgi:hypothetical protein